MSRSVPSAVVLIFLALSLLSTIAEAKPLNAKDYKLGVSGFVGWDVGQVVKGAGIDAQSYGDYRPWINEPLMTLMLDATLNDRVRAYAGLGAQIWFNTIHHDYSLPRGWLFLKYCSVFIDRAEGVASFPNNDNPMLQIGFGVFPYKYNEDARNLGEYLFRSTAYPALVYGGFESAFYRFTGLRASLSAVENLRADLIVSSETEIQPYGDFSLAAVADYDIAKIVKVGAGVQFYHLISIDENLTTPDSSSEKPDLYSYVDEDGNTAFYTHRGTKLMGRLRLDPKQIFARDGDFGIWGTEDFKIYGEIALLGLKDYPDQADSVPGPAGSPATPRDVYKGYNDIKQKMPIMFGVNIPTTKWGFDVLSLEFEWFGIEYPNDHFMIYTEGYARQASTDNDDIKYKNDNWKWSAYAKRHIGDHFFISLLFARDHTKLKTINNQYQEYATPDVLIRPGDWWWMTRIGVEF